MIELLLELLFESRIPKYYHLHGIELQVIKEIFGFMIRLLEKELVHYFLNLKLGTKIQPYETKLNMIIYITQIRKCTSVGNHK